LQLNGRRPATRNARRRWTIASLPISILLLAPAASSAQSESRVTASMHVYTEPAAGPFGRLDVVGPSLLAQIEVHPDITVDASYTADAVSGASPAVLGVVDGISAASPFSDFRHAATAGVSWVTGLSTLRAGLSFGHENDYQSLGVTASYARDLAQRNTTVFGGLSFLADTVGTVAEPDLDSLKIASGSAGVTQVLSRDAIVRLTYQYAYLNGLLGSPYRWIAIPGTSELIGAVVRERPPRTRHRHALGAQGRYHLNAWVRLGVGVDLSADSWGLSSASVEGAAFGRPVDDLLLRLRVRGYVQSSADFWKKQYDGTEDFVTGDRELGPLRNLRVDLRASYELRWADIELSPFLSGGVMAFEYLDHVGLEGRSAVFGQGGISGGW
jgi:hypothetical protein